MSKVLVVALLVAFALWFARSRLALGEWLRRMSDVPANAALLGTSGFERGGRDPRKRP